MLRFIQRRAGTSVTFQTASFVRISTRTKRRRPLPASVRSIPEEDPTKLWSCHRCHFLSTNSHPEEEGPRENGPKAKTPMQQQHPSVASAYIPPGIEVQVSGVPTDKIGYAQFASVGNNDEDSETRRTPRTEGEAIGEDRKHADNYFASLDHHSSAGTSSTDDDEIWEAANTASDNDDSPTSSSGTASDDEEAPSDGGDPREHPLETLRKRTVAFTNEENTPFGSFTPEMWYESVRLLGHWTRGMELSNTPETVDQSFLLLDRLVFEQELQKYHALSVSLLNTRLLNRIIWNWRRCVKSFHHYSVEDQALLRFEFTPMELLARLEEYSNRSPHLQPNTKTFNMIMDGARCCCVPSNTGVSGMISPRVATNFAQSLFDRMVAADEAQTKSNSDDVQYSHTDAKGGPSIKPNVETYSTLIQLFSHHGLATRAEALLDKMYKNFKETEDPSLTPTVKIFTTVLSAWSRSEEYQAPERAESILYRMQELSDCGLLSVAPDAVTYIVALHCWARSTKTRNKKSWKDKNLKVVASNSIARAQKLFSKMKQLGHANTKAYNVMMNILAKDGRVEEAEQLLAEMYERFAAGEKTCPNSATYNTLLTAWARSGNRKCAERAEEILKDFEDKYRAGELEEPPGLVTYNSVLLCLSQAKEGERAEALIRKMLEMQNPCGKDVRPDIISFNTCVNAFARAGDPRKAEEILESMYKEYTKTHDASIAPTVETFSTVLTAWLKSKEPTAAERAEAILRTMQKLHKAGILEVEPNSIAFNIVLTAWFQSNDRYAPRRAEMLLTEMEDLYDAGSKVVKPDAMAYEHCIEGYANRRNARKAEDVLERRHTQSLSAAHGGGGNLHAKPTLRSYNKVLGSYKRDINKDAAQRADSLCRRLLERHDAGIVDFPPDSLSVQLVLEAWYNAASYDRAAGKRARSFVQDLQKSKSSPMISMGSEAHNKLIEIFVKLIDAESADEYFRKVCNDSIQQKESASLKLDVSSLNKVLGVWRKSNSKEAGERIEALLTLVKENPQLGIQPNLASYKIFLNCLEDNPSLWSASQADATLEEMEKIASVEAKKPNAQDYTQILRIWSKIKDKSSYKHAEQVFQKMKDQFDAGHVHCTPTIASYHALINCWSVSEEADANERIRQLRAQMAEIKHQRESTR